MKLTITHQDDWESFDDGSSELVIGPYRATVHVEETARGERVGINAAVTIPGARTIARCNDVAGTVSVAREWCEDQIRNHSEGR